MRAIHRIISCALCIAGMGSAAATNLDTQPLDSSPHAAIDSASPHDGNSGGGDVTGLNRDCTPASDSSSTSTTSGNSSDHSGGDSSSMPMPSRRAHLGWQSLLPGSIQ